MIKSFFQTSIASYIVLGITMLTSVVIARHYGPTGQGTIAALLLIPQLMISYGDLGVSESIMYHLSNKEGQIKFVKITLLKIFGAMVFLMMIGFIIYLLFFTYSDLNNSYLLGFLYLFFLFLNQLLTFIFRGQLKLTTYNFSLLIFNVLILILVCTCVFLNLSVIFVFMAYVFASFFSSIYLLLKLKFKTTIDTPKKEFSIKEIYSYGLKTYAYKVLNSTESQFDKFIIASFLPKSQLGFYSVAVVFSSLLYLFIVKPISSIILPILNKVEIISEKQKLITLINKLIFWIGIFFGLFLLAFSKLLIQLIYGTDYLPALIPLWILLVGIILKAPMSILGYYFKSIGSPEVMVKISTITVILNVIAGIVFIPKYGIIAAALISTISYTIYSFLLSKKYMQSTKQGYLDQYLFNKNEMKLIRKYIQNLKSKF